ncbi:MAG TPA: non-homologous end-joining DNA ligase [Pseudonocardiaceae bacterium]|jgi:bifunctional non-homologous end joining protein LigD|nr:non-homologous end-joining DNA ligase [Pseudonocardiaceae bacterium]
MTSHTVRTSNPDKELYPGITKGEVLDYYGDIAETMLPHLRDRPLTLHRFPDGIGKSGFFQQRAGEHFPDWLRTAAVPRSGGDGTVRHAVCDDEPSLRYLANQAVLEFHTWLSTADRPQHPVLLVVDLDPPDGVDLADLRSTARRTAELFHQVGLVPFAQTTGGRGFHIVAPLDGRSDYELVRPLARELAERLAEAEPDKLTIEQRKDQRGERIFLDVNRNAYGQTAIAPYSLRSRPGAPVATPIDLDEVGRVTPDKYTLHNVRRRLANKPDPWADLARHAVSAADVRARSAG